MTEIAVAPLKAITLKERIVDVIREAIASGKLDPGDRIIELKLAKQLGVGTTAVREALFELERTGFVKRVPNKGTFVTQVTSVDAQHIFRVRRELEGLAAELLTEHVTPPDLERLQQLVDEMKAAAEAARFETFYERDLDFHRALWLLSGNPFLVNVLETLVVPLFAFFIMRTRPDSRAALLLSAERHETLLRSLQAKHRPKQSMEASLDVSSSFWEHPEWQSEAPASGKSATPQDPPSSGPGVSQRDRIQAKRVGKGANIKTGTLPAQGLPE
jgi:DNA-binding GntR family transcriptional regulator